MIGLYFFYRASIIIATGIAGLFGAYKGETEDNDELKSEILKFCGWFCLGILLIVLTSML